MNDTTDENKQHGRKKRNLTVICLAFVSVYISLNAVNNLQSSINIDKNVGLNSLAIITAGVIFSCLFVTTPLIVIWGYKWTIVAGQIGILIYIAVNMYPKAALFYPMALISGLLRGTMWTSQNAYITVLGIDENHNDDSDDQVNKYFGIFYSAYQTAQIWGNLIAYFILRGASQSSKNSSSKCGASFSPSENVQNADDENSIPLTTTYILYNVFIGIVLVSIVFVAIFLDQKRKPNGDDSKSIVRESLDYTLSTLKQLKNPKHLLLAPIVFWINAFDAFIFGVYTKSFITCTIGIQYIGLVMAAYGITASIFSVCIGYVAKLKHSRPICFLLAAFLTSAILVVMLVWEPNSSQAYVLYILACISGFSAAIVKPLTPVLYSTIFVDTKEIAFSIYAMLQNVGLLVVYLYSSTLTVRVSIILQMIYTGVAVLCYIIVELRLFRASNNNLQSNVLNNLVIVFPDETHSEKVFVAMNIVYIFLDQKPASSNQEDFNLGSKIATNIIKDDGEKIVQQTTDAIKKSTN